MWFLRRRATISSGRSIRKRTVFSARGATSARTWRMSTWSLGTWIMWERRVHKMITATVISRETLHTHFKRSLYCCLMAVSPCCCCLVLGAHHRGGSEWQHGPVSAGPVLCPDAAAAPDTCHPGVFRWFESEAVAHSRYQRWSAGAQLCSGENFKL